MERSGSSSKLNTSARSFDDNSSYRERPSHEENTDSEENTDNEEEQRKDPQDRSLSCSPGQHYLSPERSPQIGQRQQQSLSPKGSDKKSPRTENEPRGSSYDSGSKVSVDDNVGRRRGIHEHSIDHPQEIAYNHQFQVKHIQRSTFYKETIVTKRGYSTEKKDTVTRDENIQQYLQKNIHVPAIGVLFFLIIVAAIYFSKTDHHQNERYDSEEKPNQWLQEFLQGFNEMNSSFPAQTSAFWRVLRSGTRSIMIPEVPAQPAVFIVAVPKEAEQTAMCIVRKYATIVTKAFHGYQPVEFTHHLRNADTPEHVKQVIDSTLNDGFSKGSRVAIIHELHKLHGKSAMMFHGYCDNDNAPFTRVAIIFILHLDAVSEETDDVVEERLAQVWGKYLDNDKLFPLLSRIGNRNAFVRQETSDVLKMNNCV